MPLRFFVVPALDGGSAAQELNAFLRSHRVLGLDRHWVDQGMASYWSLCVDYAEAAAPAAPTGGRSAAGRAKIDYREVLSPEDFAVFARLRELRKQIAQDDAVPVYTIFTNEQLARMVQERVTTRAALEKVAGIGDARVEKYGPRVLDMLARAWPPVNGEKDRQPV